MTYEEIIKEHGRWLLSLIKGKSHEGECADLSGANLSGYNLSRILLAGANLSKAQLRGADLSEAQLSGANLSGAQLSGADLSEANLANANLSDVDLTDANLYKTNLSGANLSNAELYKTYMHKTEMVGANLSSANLMEAYLSRANLSKANLSEARLFGTHLSRTYLYKANLRKVKCNYTVFSLLDLSTCLNLETIEVESPCTIDFQTLSTSKNIPKSFLLKIGLPEIYINYLPDFYQNEGIRYYPVFLSHSSINKPFAQKLYEALIARGVNVFFDEKKMMPGDDLYESISKGIDYYDKMILVCSEESLSDSWWVDREIDRILSKERDLFKKVGHRVNLLIPIAIDDYVFNGWNGAKKEEVKRYIIGDFRSWQDKAAFEDSLNKLIHALNVDRPDIKPVSYLPRK